MPIYGQVCPACLHAFEDFRPISRCDNQPACPRCGKQSHRDYGTGSERHPGYTTPLLSEALGVHASQIPEANKRFPDHEFTSDGRMVLRSHEQRQRVLKQLGFHDRDGYYG